jgi:alpha-ketoglutarate-dependent 2,4-dichlorophenoxyacetate dioxygenase
MALSIRPIDPVHRPDFAGEVSGIDLREAMTPQQVPAIVEGMDKFAVLVFHDQKIDDEQQLAFSRNFGPLEIANSDVRRDEDRRLAPEIADISNLGKGNDVMSREDRRRLFGLGNMLWHSDSSFKPTPAKYSLLHARVLPAKDGNTEFADMRAAYDALDDDVKAEIADLVCEHSQIYSRGILGFDSPRTSDNAICPCRSGWCAAIPARGGARSSFRRMPARSTACRCPRRAPCCAT